MRHLVSDEWQRAETFGRCLRMAGDDPHQLQRFVDAQRDSYDRALGELQRGRKTSHWMWFIFPQLAGLGHSAMAQRYAIRSLDEARAYLTHPLLGPRLRECVAALLQHSGHSADAIMGGIDAVKLRSAATLFDAAGGGPAFGQLLDAFFGGQPDPATERLLTPG